MTACEPSDTSLIEAAQQGGTAGQRAFSRLVVRHNAWLVGLLTNLLGHRGDAEDVAQDAFVRAFLAVDRFRLGESVQTWLRVIATRLAYNRMRNRATRGRYNSAFGDERRLERPQDDSVATRELLGRMLDAMSYPHREVLVLHHVEELSVKEIAATLQIGLSATKMRLSRARAEFVALYNEEVGGDE